MLFFYFLQNFYFSVKCVYSPHNLRSPRYCLFNQQVLDVFLLINMCLSFKSYFIVLILHNILIVVYRVTEPPPPPPRICLIECVLFSFCIIFGCCIPSHGTSRICLLECVLHKLPSAVISRAVLYKTVL